MDIDSRAGGPATGTKNAREARDREHQARDGLVHQAGRLVKEWYRPVFALRDAEDDAAGTEVRDLSDWRALLASLEVALQPVISMQSGRAVGFEALLRGSDAFGYPSVKALLNAACRDGAMVIPDGPGGAVELLRLVELAGWSRAVAHFSELGLRRDARLFLNLDSRLLSCWPVMVESLQELMTSHGLDRASVAVELSERYPLLGGPSEHGAGDVMGAHVEAVSAAAQALRRVAGKLALDDFGAGHASLPVLYALKPDIVKLDRFFITDVDEDQTKKVFLSNLVNMCHLMGIQVVAKGVEDIRDFYRCRDAGCDLVQGHLLAPPTTAIDTLVEEYPAVTELNTREQRGAGGDVRLVEAQTTVMEPIRRGAPMTSVFDRFRKEKDRTFFPVVDETGEPLGLVRELDLKDYTYSLYGKDLISNKGLGRNLEAFISRCPTVDIGTKAEKILQVFSANADSEGLIITEDGKYKGFLTAPSLLRVINEKNLQAARDQNPLTKLPGNTLINEYIAEMLGDSSLPCTLAYIDFDFFKPFNDKYGFRQGDRAILLFAELLRSQIAAENTFVAHVGGDDFFAGFRNVRPAEAEESTRALVRRFEQDVASFYDEETRARGYVVAKDREGVERRMPLLSASAALVHLRPGHETRDIDAVSGLIARLKKDAKAAVGKLAAAEVSASGAG